MPFDTAALNKRVDEVTNLDYAQRRYEIHHRLTDPRLSRFLYKYREVDVESTESLERISSILVDSKLWFSPSKDLNDPYELSANIILPKGAERKTLFKELLKRQGIGFKKREEIVRRQMLDPDSEMERVIEDSFHKQLQKIGVCSFAGDPRSILMWSHYARNHSGICIQFERARDPAFCLAALPTTYGNDYPLYNWGTDKAVSDLTNIVLAKHSVWAYERENRILEDGSARKEMSFAPVAITGLIFGCESTIDIQEAVFQMLYTREKLKLSPIKLWRAVKDRKQYRLKIMRWVGKMPGYPQGVIDKH